MQFHPTEGHWSGTFVNSGFPTKFTILVLLGKIILGFVCWFEEVPKVFFCDKT